MNISLQELGELVNTAVGIPRTPFGIGGPVLLELLGDGRLLPGWGLLARNRALARSGVRGRSRGAGLFDAAFLRGAETDAVCADHRAGLADDAVADRDVRADPGTGVDKGVVADNRMLGDRDVGRDAGVPADFDIGSDDDERSDGRALADFGGGINDGRGVDARSDGGARIHQLGEARHSIARAGHDDGHLEPQRPPVGTVPDDGGASGVADYGGRAWCGSPFIPHYVSPEEEFRTYGSATARSTSSTVRDRARAM